MKNLAGVKTCDVDIRKELGSAEIELVEHGQPARQEVPASVTGQLKQGEEVKFTFRRAWYYWVVRGLVPLSVAEKLYEHPAGRQDVRVAGHCGCPPPEEWTNGLMTWIDPESGPPQRVLREPAVSSYHIDTQAGLNFFVQTLRQHGLVD